MEQEPNCYYQLHSLVICHSTVCKDVFYQLDMYALLSIKDNWSMCTFEYGDLCTV